MNNLLKNIYINLPIPIKNKLISTYGYYLNKKRFGKYYKRHYKQLLNNLDLSKKELEILQLKKLKELLKELDEYSEYYNDIIKDIGGINKLISLNNKYEILSKFPIMEKDYLRNNLDYIINKNPNRKTYSKTNTSGTTGTPMTIEVDKESLQLSFAQWERYYRWLGLPNDFKSVRLSGRIIIKEKRDEKPFWVYNKASKQLFMSTYHLHPQNIMSYIDKINEYSPEFIDGYPSAIYVIARFINQNNIELDSKAIAISTTAETLNDYQRSEIQKAFNCKVYNQYASSEGAPWIVECEEGNFHLWIDTGIFEFANIKKIDKNISKADLIVTSFRSLKTPLIRYDIGDTVLLSNNTNEKCECGSEFPIIKGVIGREDDILYTEEKGYVGRLDTAYKGLKGIFRSKIIQKDINNIDVLIIPTEDYSLDIENSLKENLIKRLGNIKINIKLVEDIPLGSNGKFKAVENQMDKKL